MPLSDYPILGAEICQDQETFLAPYADKQTCNYSSGCSNHHPSLSIHVWQIRLILRARETTQIFIKGGSL